MKYEPVQDHAERKRILALIERCEKEQMMNDLIRREDIRTALKENVIEMGGDDWCEPGVHCGDIDAIVNSVPSTDRPKKVVAQIIFDEEKLREIVKEAVERFKEEYEITDRPQGEWIEDYNGNGWNDYWDYTCSNCGKKYERADAVLYKANYCPNCGAQMKGADDE